MALTFATGMTLENNANAATNWGFPTLVGAAYDSAGVDTTVAAIGTGSVRDDRYEDLIARDPTQKVFYGGWEKRCDALCDAALVPRTLDRAS